MKRLLLLLLFYGISAKLQLIAITHKSCPVCEKWQEEVYPNYVNEAKRHHYPLIKVLDLSVKEHRDYVLDTFGYLSYIPMFIVTNDEEKISEFGGYESYKAFFEDLDKALEDAPRDGLEPPTK